MTSISEIMSAVSSVIPIVVVILIAIILVMVMLYTLTRIIAIAFYRTKYEFDSINSYPDQFKSNTEQSLLEKEKETVTWQ